MLDCGGASWAAILVGAERLPIRLVVGPWTTVFVGTVRR